MRTAPWDSCSRRTLNPNRGPAVEDRCPHRSTGRRRYVLGKRESFPVRANTLWFPTGLLKSAC